MNSSSPDVFNQTRRGKLHRHYNIYQSCIDKLDDMYGCGRGSSKYTDKKARRRKNRRKQNKEKIYGISTLKKYKEIWRRYCRFLQSRKIRIHNWLEARKHIPDYLDDLISRDLSPSYIKTVACALNKPFYGAYLSDYNLPSRTRESITRSRAHSAACYQDACKKHPDIFRFCLASGLRKDKELARLCGTALTMHNSQYCLVVKGKGGQMRSVPLRGDSETLDWIVRLCHAAGNQKVFSKVPGNLDVHALRAVYACLFYQEIARPVDKIPKEEQYCCRKDYKGIVLDRAALRIVSEALGHHRVSVIPQSYIWPFVLFDAETKAFFGLRLELRSEA